MIRSMGKPPQQPGAPSSLRAATVVVNPGLVNVSGKIVSVTVPGVRPGDLVFASAPLGMSLGLGIGNVRVSGPDKVEISLLCTILGVGVSLGILTLTLLIISFEVS